MLTEIIGSNIQRLEQAGKNFIQRMTMGYTKSEVQSVLNGDISPAIRQRFFTEKVQNAGIIAFCATRQPDITGITYMLEAHRTELEEAKRLSLLDGEDFDQELALYIKNKAQLFGLRTD